MAEDVVYFLSSTFLLRRCSATCIRKMQEQEVEVRRGVEVEGKERQEKEGEVIGRDKRCYLFNTVRLDTHRDYLLVSRAGGLFLPGRCSFVFCY